MAEPERGPWLDFQPPAQTDGPWTLYQNQSRNFGIDFTRPISEVRAAIGRLPQTDRQEALRQWAEAYVSRERSERGAVGGILNEDLVRSVSRGTFIGPWLDEANALTAAGLHRLTGGYAGSPYDEAVAYNRAQDRAVDRERPFASGAAQVVGALSPLRGLAGGPLMRGRSLPTQMLTGSGIGALHAASYDAGTADERADALPLGENLLMRVGAGAEAAPVGAVFGAAVPPLLRGGNALVRPVVDWATPTVARMGAHIRDIPRRIGLHFSADGAPPPNSVGARAAAEEVLALGGLSGGLRGQDLRNALLESERSSLFHGGGARGAPGASYAENVLTLGDVHSSLQKTVGSAMRASNAAGDIGETFLRARQTGIAPSGTQRLESISGLTTRESMARPERGARPSGQVDRVGDGFRRSLLLEDNPFHGHTRSPAHMEDMIINTARRNARQFYHIAYRGGRGVDMVPHVEPTLVRWEARLANESDDMRAELTRLIAMFRDSRTIERFDRNKRRALDDAINNAVRSGDDYRVARLTQFKDDLLHAVDNIQEGNLGAMYGRAREMFSSDMEMRDLYRAGFNFWKENSEHSIDFFRGVTGEGQNKIVRFGLLGGYYNTAERTRSGADRLAMFDTPRMQNLLAWVIPRTETATGRVRIRGGEEAVFSDRPQRFGRFLENEGRMIQTRNRVVGGSPTQGRAMDDERYRALTFLADVTETFKQTGSVSQAAFKILDRAIRSVVGMRADTSEWVTRLAFTADPAERARVFEAVARRMDANTIAQISKYLQEHQGALAGATARGVAGATSGQ